MTVGLRLETLTVDRVLEGRRRGSSRPIVVDTPGGRRLVKLRGAAQGTGALVAEIIVAALAEALGLRVPARSLVFLEPDVAVDDRDQELADLLAASVGLNLGFAVLDGARDASARDLERMDPAEAAAVLWLDGLVLNPDRTHANVNLLCWNDRLWLIDHGAALRFQYNWPMVTESTPREVGMAGHGHVFDAARDSADWPVWDEAFAACLTRSVLEEAVATVPAELLVPLLPRAHTGSVDEALIRRRVAYVAFLWKRLKSPRAFARVERRVA